MGIIDLGDWFKRTVFETGIAKPLLVFDRVQPATACEGQRVIYHIIPALQHRAVKRVID